jgi:hypothetical protein
MQAELAPLRAISALFLWCATISSAVAHVDCAQAVVPLEKAICADPTLAAVNDRLEARLAAAMLRSLDPGGLRDAQRDWLTRYRWTPPDRDAIAVAFEQRTGFLDGEITRFEAIAGTLDLTDQAARESCPAWLTDGMVGACAPRGFGEIGTVADRVLAYSLYGFSLGQNMVATVAVVYERRDPAGSLHALFAPKDPATVYSAPQILKAGSLVVLHIPGYESGTGNFNRERLFGWRAGGWGALDTTSWLIDNVVHLLPGGFEVMKGIYPDYAAMTATTPLWRKKTDGYCCPTGGRADFVLGWQGDRLVAKSVQVKLGARFAK